MGGRIHLADPDANLRELRAISVRVRAEHRLTHAEVERAAELFLALDQWLESGGTLPADWHLSTCLARTCRGGSAAEHGGE